MIKKLLLLPLILLFISCSVTKRVHRPGFHVQWHKIHRTQPSEKLQTSEKTKKESERMSSSQEMTARPKKVSENDSLMVHVIKVEETASPTLTELQTKKRFSRLSSVVKRTEIPSILRTKNKKAKIASHSSRRPIFWRMSAKNLKSLGIVLMCFGALIVIGALMSTAGAFSGGGSGAWANFFIDLIAISEWFWGLVFILIIVLLLYLSVLLVRYVFGGFLIGSIIGLSLLSLGIFFHTLGKNREIEP